MHSIIMLYLKGMGVNDFDTRNLIFEPFILKR